MFNMVKFWRGRLRMHKRLARESIRKGAQARADGQPTVADHNMADAAVQLDHADHARWELAYWVQRRNGRRAA